MQNLRQLEEQMLAHLSSDVRLLNDLAITKKLAELKKQFDETKDRSVCGEKFLKNFLSPKLILNTLRSITKYDQMP